MDLIKKHSQQIYSSKRIKYERDTVDLTKDDLGEPIKGSDLRSDIVHEEEVTIITVPKSVPLLDISGDNENPVWSSLTL